MEAGKHWFAAVIAAFLVGHLLLAAWIPPMEDELYYWTWAKDLQWSYFDHPPLTAYLIRVSTAVLGDSIFAIRLPACLLSTGVVVLLAGLATGRLLLLLLLATPIFLLGSILMTPDVPLLFCWTLYLVWLAGICRSFASWNDDPISRVYCGSPVSATRWAAGGAILGLGILSKYTMLLAVPCTLLALLALARWRAWAGGFALGLAVATLVAAPVVIFNWQHDFAPLAFQWRHAGFKDPHPPQFFQFLGGQLALVGGLPFLMVPWVILRWRDLARDPVLLASLWLFVPVFAFFMGKAIRSPLEGNWPMVAYVGFWPLATRLFEKNSLVALGRAIVFAGFSVPLATSTLIAIHLVRPFEAVPPHLDRIGWLHAQWALSETVAADSRGVSPAVPVLAPSYQWVSYLRFRGISADQIPGVGRRSHFSESAGDPCRHQEVLVFEDAGPRAPTLDCFSSSRTVVTYPLTVRGQQVGLFQLTRYARPGDRATSLRPSPGTSLARAE